MDFHPLVIHYPIAFLTTYSIFELLRFKQLLSLPYWFYLKGTLVVIGELGAIATVVFAQMSPGLAGESVLAETYKIFIVITYAIFGTIALAYIHESKSARLIMKPVVLMPLVILGLFFIVVAGGLFGATVYGTHFDPFLKPIFELLSVY